MFCLNVTVAPLVFNSKRTIEKLKKSQHKVRDSKFHCLERGKKLSMGVRRKKDRRCI